MKETDVDTFDKARSRARAEWDRKKERMKRIVPGTGGGTDGTARADAIKKKMEKEMKAKKEALKNLFHMEWSEGQRKAMRTLLITFLILYAVLMFLVVHVSIVRYGNPLNDLWQNIAGGFVDMIRPTTAFRIFPIPPGTGQAMGAVTALVAVAGAILYLYAGIVKHDNPDTVQGDAKWLKDLYAYNERFTEPFGSPSHDGPNNMILSQDLFLSMDIQHTRRNLNVFVIGGSGAGKSFNLVGPNIMQANCSMVITDPSAGLYKEYGRFLEYKGYRVKCFNLERMDLSNHYNPFRYIHSDKDIMELVKTLITNTTPPEASKGDPFWEKAETAFDTALIAYIYHYTDTSSHNFSSLMRLLRSAKMTESETSTQKSPLDFIFDEVRKYDPESFAVKQYDLFKTAPAKTAMSILITGGTRLAAFDLDDVMRLTGTDDIDLDSVGNEKTALFICIPTGDGGAFNFLAAMMYSQLFQRMYAYCQETAEFGQLIMDGNEQVVRVFQAENPKESADRAREAGKYLTRIKEGRVVYNKDMQWYEIRTSKNELVTYRGSKEEAEAELSSIRDKGHVLANGKRSNHGQRLPIHCRFLLDEFANIGKIPAFEQLVATMRKYEISVTIILQSLTQMKKMYKDDWSGISGNCDTTIYLGGGADQETTEWLSKLLGKETRVVMNSSFSKNGGSTSLNRTGVELYSPSQLRTMPEDECIVIPKSLNAYKGRKYRTIDHPNKALVDSLPPYDFDLERLHYLQKEDGQSAAGWGADEPEEEPKPEETHGLEEPAEEEEPKQKESRNEQAAQAKAATENMDEQGTPVEGSPAPADGNGPLADTILDPLPESAESRDPMTDGVTNDGDESAGKPLPDSLPNAATVASDEFSRLIEQSETGWGEIELIFDSRPPEDG
ncbi:MAG: VirD4-like conjugal transfer protein, CD1115 family [Chordicoccus sp.]